MEFRILGPLEVVRDGRPLALGGTKQRAVLAILLLHRNEVVPAERLVDLVWGENPPPTAANALQGYVFQLRRALEPGHVRGTPYDVIASNGTGYALRPDRAAVDVDRFILLAERARGVAARDPRAAASLFADSLASWRGPALADLAYEPWAQPEIDRLEELRLATVEERFDAQLACGHDAGLVGELRRLIRAHPLRERLRGQLMLALYRAGRQADALDAFAQARATLVDELGVEPGPELRALQRQILEQDDALTAAMPTSAPAPFPAPVGELIGRERELAQVGDLLRSERLVTIVGPGGVGKTRLALHAAAGLADAFADGVFFVDLSSVATPELVVPSIAAVVGAEGDLTQRVAAKELLLVVDNFEHVVAAAPTVAELLADCPNIRLLVTSREPLHVRAERELPLGPLAEAAAVELFRARAEAVQPDFDAPTDVLTAIAERLDGLPLALELAAARAKALPPHELLARLERRLPLLTGRGRDVAHRQRTLRTTIDWSYELLAGDEKQLFERLSVFAGGWTLGAAEAVCGADLDILESLIDKSLVRHSRGRYSMLETIREYARERLDEDHNAGKVTERHARYYLTVVSEADEQLIGPDQGQWLTRLAWEQDNLRAALAWAADAGKNDLLLALVAAAGWFWFMRGQLEEGASWIDYALGTDAGPQPTRATCLMRAGAIAHGRGEHDAAEGHYREALNLRRDGGDLSGAVSALNNLGVLANARADYEAAGDWYEQGLALAREIGDELGVATALGNMGIVANNRDDPARAVDLLEESIRENERLGHSYALAVTSQALGSAYLALGEAKAAAAHLGRALTLHGELEEPLGVATTLDALAELAVVGGRPDLAARHLGAAQGIRVAAGAAAEPAEEARRVQTSEAAAGAIGARAFEDAFAAGLGTEVGQAIELALASID